MTEEEKTMKSEGGKSALPGYGGPTDKFVTFHLDRESFAVNILSVQEINLMSEITVTRIPKSPDFLKGVLNLRGKIIPVVNFRLRLGLPEKGADALTRVIVAKLRGNLFGFIVDSISSVVELAQNKIDPAPSSVAGIDAQFIEGVSKERGSLLTILDLEKVLFSS